MKRNYIDDKTFTFLVINPFVLPLNVIAAVTTDQPTAPEFFAKSFSFVAQKQKFPPAPRKKTTKQAHFYSPSVICLLDMEASG